MGTPQLSRPPHSLSALLAPEPEARFLEKYLGEEFLSIPGHRQKFRELLGWRELNNILSYQAVAPHLRMSKEGTQLPLASFLKTKYTVSGHSIQSPHSSAVVAHLRDGASLILNEIDALHPPIRALAEGLEAATRSVVQVNLYASWRSSPGFDLHYDAHDVFILQIEGPKHWKVFRPTDRYPVTYKTERKPDLLSLDPVFDGVLKPGDVLYIPRGWWHIVTPLDEPTMHLTAGLHPPTGIKLVEWAMRDLAANELLRMDLPRFWDQENQRKYLAAVREIIANLLGGEDLIERFLDHLEATSDRRPRFSLPASATPEVLPDSDDSIITLGSPSGFRPKPGAEPGDIRIAFAGKELTFSDATLPLFDHLSQSAPLSVADFCRRFEHQFPAAELKEFLAELARHGAILVSEPEIERG
jgi:hypothetical protein